MKKTLLFMLILALMATGCKKKRALNYNDTDPIVMALSGPEHIQNLPDHYFDHQIQVTSHYDITYSAINPNNIEVIKVSNDGYIHGKNVGQAKVRIDNGYEERVINVVVDLFRQPTFEFGCSSNRIKSLYGNPYASGMNGDTILVYQYTTQHGYSYACGEMDFFFYNGGYYEADVYIRPTVEYLLNNYLTENFNYRSFIYDTALYADTLFVYKHKIDTTIVCGKFKSHNQWDEFCLFYYQSAAANSLDRALKNLPRSSKLRY